MRSEGVWESQGLCGVGSSTDRGRGDTGPSLARGKEVLRRPDVSSRLGCPEVVRRRDIRPDGVCCGKAVTDQVGIDRACLVNESRQEHHRPYHSIPYGRVWKGLSLRDYREPEGVESRPEICCGRVGVPIGDDSSQILAVGKEHANLSEVGGWRQPVPVWIEEPHFWNKEDIPFPLEAPVEPSWHPGRAPQRAQGADDIALNFR